MRELPGDPDAETPGRASSAVLVFVGGAFGTAARYGLELLSPAARGEWPVATFGINLAGAFLLGVILERLARAGHDRGNLRRTRLLAATGFCGGFTTYSTLALETDHLFRAGHPVLGLAYPALSLLAGVLAAGAGVLLARRARA